MCRWGVVPSQMAFFTFGPKKVHIFCSCEPPGKNVPVFKLESDRSCWDWQLIWFLTSWPIYYPFKSQPKLRQKCKIWHWCQFYHKIVNRRKICNVQVDAPMCPLQIINWHWTSIIDRSWCKCTLYPPPIQCQNYLIGYKSETDWPKQKLKNGVLENIFLHPYAGFGLKIQNTNGQKSSLNFFDICKIGT